MEKAGLDRGAVTGNSPCHPATHTALPKENSFDQSPAHRRSKLLGLEWGDVDLDLLSLKVQRALHRLKNGSVVIEEPKTEKGRRAIALTPASALVLREHRQYQESLWTDLGRELTDADRVFSMPGGLSFMPDSISHAFKQIAKKAGLGGVTLQGLRHTHVSLMLRAGVAMKVVQERLGHANIAVTADIYTHVYPDLRQEAAAAFEAVLEKRRQEAPLANG